MNDRVHDALDGSLSRDDLTLAERDEARRLQSAVDAVADRLAREPTPDLTGPVMRELERRARRNAVSTTAALTGAGSSGSPSVVVPVPEGSPARGRWFRLLWQPRQVTVRPAWGLLAAAVLASLVLLPPALLPPRGSDGAVAARVGTDAGDRETSAVTGAGEGVTVFVQFRLHAPEASEVRLAGSFTAWEPLYRLQDSGEGVWTLLVPLEPGIHDYAFILDGVTWIPDPAAPRVDDGFGGENSRLALLPENGVRES
jgi:hypothetical protein